MSKSVFFDIQLGASGDMLVGSLMDTGIDTNQLGNMLNKLKLSNWDITPEKITKYHFSGTLANIICKDDTHHRNLKDIHDIIIKSELPEDIVQNIIRVFENLADAEAKVHGKKQTEIHFHEVGAIDSIIDISAFCILIKIMNIDKIYYNSFPLGTGTVKSAHGEIPVPVPAVVELIKKHKSTQTDKAGEQITPTAAAILTTLGTQMLLSEFTVLESGVGFGTRDYSFPSFTRAIFIETIRSLEDIQQIECNIDDMNPQLYPNVIEMLFNSGALDAYTSVIMMKKGRPGILLTVIANAGDVANLKNIIYTQTTTLGMRLFKITRDKLNREYDKVSAFGEEIRIKIGYLNGIKVNIQPEYEDCKIVANKLNLPLKEVITESIHQYKNKNA